MAKPKACQKKSQPPTTEPEPPSQGTRVNLSGIALQNAVLNQARHYGFQGRIRKVQKAWALGGKDTQIGVWIEPCPQFPDGLGIEVTGQTGKGTGANKLPYKIWSIMTTWAAPGVLVVEGDGRDLPKMREWARNQVGQQIFTNGNSDRLLGVFTLEEFSMWIGGVSSTQSVPQPVVYMPLPPQLPATSGKHKSKKLTSTP